MDIHEFRAKMEHDRKLLRQGIAPAGTTTCSCCGKPLQGAVTGRHLVGGGEPADEESKTRT